MGIGGAKHRKRRTCRNISTVRRLNMEEMKLWVHASIKSFLVSHHNNGQGNTSVGNNNELVPTPQCLPCCGRK
jgi:hypothetical protein